MKTPKRIILAIPAAATLSGLVSMLHQLSRSSAVATAPVVTLLQSEIDTDQETATLASQMRQRGIRFAIEDDTPAPAEVEQEQETAEVVDDPDAEPASPAEWEQAAGAADKDSLTAGQDEATPKDSLEVADTSTDQPAADASTAE